VKVRKEILAMATISCGVNELTNPGFDGKTIAQIKAELGQVLNIAEDSTVLLNDVETTNLNQPLRADDRLEFVKKSGTKGA
jgi:hypothetical protein